MLFKTFKQKCFTDTKFQVTVHNLSTDEFESFKVDYLDRKSGNVDKVIELYGKKAVLTNVCFNRAINMNELSVTIK